MHGVTYARSDAGYGRTLWIGQRLLLQSPGQLTRMKPHVYRGWDEYCNPTYNLHLWPLFGAGVWWGRRLRDEADGVCAECLAEDRSSE